MTYNGIFLIFGYKIILIYQNHTVKILNATESFCLLFLFLWDYFFFFSSAFFFRNSFLFTLSYSVWKSSVPSDNSEINL